MTIGGTHLIRIVWLALSLLLSACGGGGSGTSRGGDVYPGEKLPAVLVSGPDSFLLFPNPQKQADGTLEVNSLAYATAYYEAIDPNSDRDTLAKFKAQNGIGQPSGGATGVIEESVTVGDQRDLGYGRRMTARQNADGTLAFVVDNFLVGGYGAYSPFNLEAAIVGATQWHLGTNGIEFSPGPGGTVKFVKLYTFDPVTGQRLMMANLDGRGNKAMPTVCITCHGGRGDPLTPPDATGKRLFAKVMNLVSQARGDVAAQLHPFEPAALDFSTLPGFSRAMQESKLKTINKMVLCSLPLTAASAFGEDTCRAGLRPASGGIATVNEYQSTVAEHLKDMYGGNGLPLNATTTVDSYVPTGWQSVGQSTLYANAQAQACRVCHLLRGTGNQSDINFDTYAKFDGYADRIKAHVADRGNMPLAKLIYDKYWSTPSINGPIGQFLIGKGYADGAQKPGRPVADPGPGRVVKQGATSLSAAASLYSSDYQWSIVSGPVGGASLASATGLQTTFNATADGTYRVQLIASKGAVQSTPVQITIEVSNVLPYDPAALRFATDIKPILGAGGANCVSCHQPGGNGTVIPPIWYTDYDRNGDGLTNSVDEAWFYTELRGRINFTDIVASPLLRKPSNHHHNGGQQPGFNTTAKPEPVAAFDSSATGRGNYDKVLNWILNGAPQ